MKIDQIMKKIKANKQKIFIAVTIIALFAAVVGVSYAAFSYTRTGEKLNAITTGVIKMSYEESSNVISIDKALPTTDATGKVRLKEGEYFDFTLSTTIQGTTNVNWEIAAEDVTTGSKKIDGSNIKLYLTELNTDGSETEVMAPATYSADTSANDYTGRPANMMSLAMGSTSTTFNKKYRLRMYVDESYNPQGDGGNLVFSIKVNAYGKVGEVMPTTTGPVSTVLLSSVGENGAIDTSDSEQTFITGTNPNNYIWYSGKLWRAVSIDPSDNSVKLITQWNISAIPYNEEGNTAFEGSDMQQWLNDTTRDGFLGNLRDYEKFIKIDSMWNATLTTETTKPAKTTMVTSAVGLLNVYEHTMSYNGTTYSNGYLNNGLNWWELTPFNTYNVWFGTANGVGDYGAAYSYGVRPTINLKSSVEIVSGSGTASDPYRLKGDNDTPTSGTKLATRYSGEYIRFGTGENNLYQIVSHETEGMTKIVSATPLKESGRYKKMAFASSGSSNYSSSNTIGAFLNREYLTSGNYLTTDQVSMIEDNTTWYLGTVGYDTSYKLAKYASATSSNLTSNTTTAKVGLLRLGELNSGQFDTKGNNVDYWTLTPYNTSRVNFVNYFSYASIYAATKSSGGRRPAINLKSNVVITSGDGTKENPFEVKLAG